MHEAVAVTVAVPEQHARFLLLGPADGFRLQLPARFAVELARDRYGGRVVQGHEAGELGERTAHEGFGRCGLLEGGGGDLNGRVTVPGVGAGDSDVVGAGSFESVHGVRGGGVERDDFSAKCQIFAVQSFSR